MSNFDASPDPYVPPPRLTSVKGYRTARYRNPLPLVGRDDPPDLGRAEMQVQEPGGLEDSDLVESSFESDVQGVRHLPGSNQADPLSRMEVDQSSVMASRRNSNESQAVSRGPTSPQRKKTTSSRKKAPTKKLPSADKLRLIEAEARIRELENEIRIDKAVVDAQSTCDPFSSHLLWYACMQPIGSCFC